MKRLYLHTIVFFSGLGVMAVEITASRLLAPYFGASLLVWSGLIGIVLIALSAGYPLGGYLADRISVQKRFFVLCLILWTAGLLILITPALLPVFVPWGKVSSLLIGSPVLLLAMVLPLAGKAIIIPGTDDAGRGLGGLLLSSTLGSVLGTFLPVWVTIPRLGSRETFFLCGGILCLLAAIGFLKNRFFSALLLVGVALAVLAFSIRFSQPRRNSHVIYEGESIYSFVRVVQGEDGTRRLLVNEGGGMQSYYHPDRYLTGYYWDAAALLPAINPSGESFLFLGLGGGTSARIIHRYFPSVRLEGVEIDPLIAKIGNDFFGLDQVPLHAVMAEDARVFLQSASGQQYDFVMIDVYKDNRTIPFHLATREFFEEVKGRLTARGAVLMNVSSPPSGRRLTAVIENTVASVFPYVYKLAWVGQAELILAFQEPPSFVVSPETIPPDLGELVATSLKQLNRVDFRPTGEVSTDNRSPVEILAALSRIWE